MIHNSKSWVSAVSGNTNTSNTSHKTNTPRKIGVPTKNLADKTMCQPNITTGTITTVKTVAQIKFYQRPQLCEYCEVTKSFTHEAPTIDDFGTVGPTTKNLHLAAIFEKVNFQVVINNFFTNKNYQHSFDISVHESPYRIHFKGVSRVDDKIINVHLIQAFLHNENGTLMEYSRRKVKIGFKYE